VRPLAKVKLYMGAPIKGDVGIVRLSSKAIADLKASEGDPVEVSQGTFTSIKGLFQIAKALPEDEGKNIIRMGEVDFQEKGFKVDEKATVSLIR